MCGIAGIIGKRVDNKEVMGQMLKKIEHRGPDNMSVWESSNFPVVFGHLRLSVIDLSSTAHQPMLSSDKRFSIVFNGEIYNFQDLKKELSAIGKTFRTNSDTEVLLVAYEVWGRDILQKLNGMFSFAIWDEREKELFCARDRMGEKPFKYFEGKDEFVFASEVKALLEYPGISRDVDWGAIDVAMSFRFVPAPKTGFSQIKKLPAGHYLVWKNGETHVVRYWDIGDYCADKNISLNEAKQHIWELFSDSTKLRMISDVSVGAFLSGGVDSTSVVSAMTEHTQKPVETFVISIDGESEDQKYARLASKALNTNHHEIALSDINYEEAIKKIALAYDEPFFDQSALPTTIISEYIKKYVTVVLSGDGGDELFGGYKAYSLANKLQILGCVVSTIKGASIATANVFGLSYEAEILAYGPSGAYSEYFSVWKRDLSHSKKYLAKNDLYKEGSKLADAYRANYPFLYINNWLNAPCDFTKRTMVADIRGRLSDGYLTKTDIGTMQSALELRTPFLDHRLAEFAFSLPSKFKIHKGIEKYIWKEIVKEKIPKEILERKKMGFSIPLDKIILNKMNGMVRDTLLGSNAHIHEVCKKDTIERLLEDHKNKKADYSNHIWSLLMLELWLKNYKGK